MRDTFVLNALACFAVVLVLGAAPTVAGDQLLAVLLVAGGTCLTAGLLELARTALRTPG